MVKHPCDKNHHFARAEQHPRLYGRTDEGRRELQGHLERGEGKIADLRQQYGAVYDTLVVIFLAEVRIV